MKQELVLKQKLPDGWKWSTIQEVCKQKPQSGGTPLSSNPSYYGGDIPWVITEDLTSAGMYIDSTLKKITQLGYDESNVRLFPKGTILFAMYGSIGRMSIAKIELTTNQAILGLIPDDKKIISEYLYYYLDYAKNLIIKRGRGGTQSNVNAKIVCEFQIILPPLPVQKQIVAKLDAQMAQIEIMKQEAEKEKGAITNLIFSVSDNLFNNDKSNNYPLKTIKDVCIKITDGTHRTPQYIKTGVPFLSVKDIRETGISFEDTRFISLEEHKELIKRCNPENGDILYTKVGTTGIAKEIDTDTEFSIFVSVALLKANKDLIRPSFFEKVLNSPSCKKQAEKYTQGIGNKNLVLQDLSKIEFYLPPLEIQDEIIKKHKDLSKEIYFLLDSINQKILAISLLPSSILNEVFGKYEIPNEVN